MVIMDQKHVRRKTQFLFLFIFVLVSLVWMYVSVNEKHNTTVSDVLLYRAEGMITPVMNTKHLMVSAFKDHQENGEIRIISIFYRWHQRQSLYCVLYCEPSRFRVATAKVDMHTDHFGFPFVTTDVLCQTESTCNATHVTLSVLENLAEVKNKTFLRIENRERKEENFPVNFTVCISNLFGDYNNVLQVVQTMEVYKLLGVEKVVIYNTSCGPDLEKVLLHYRDEGFLDVVSWPISNFLNPSKGWNFAEHGGDLHYFGQLSTLNECIHRNRYRSRYVLLNDIDEIIMPYQHANLELLMEDLQKQHPSASTFLIENHIFPKTQFDDSHRFSLAQWRKVPGINILEHIYREPDRPHVFNPTKMIVNPRQVVQASVHSVLKSYGESFLVPPDVCRIVHVRTPLQGKLTKKQLFVDTKLWEYEEKLIPNVNRVLLKSGLL